MSNPVPIPYPKPKPTDEIPVVRARKVIGDAPEMEYLLADQDYSSFWSSPEAFARRIRALNEKEAWCNAGWDQEYGSEWSGTNTMKEALDLAESGWSEGVAEVEKMRQYIQAQIPTLPKDIKYGIAGSVPNVPRAVSGNIMNMKAQDMAKSRRRPVITIFSNMSALGGVSSKCITNRAAVTAAIIDQIESQGYSCEVISGATSRGHNKGFLAITAVMAKRSDQPLDVGRVAYALGHAAMFRRLAFADWGVSPECRQGLGSGLGGMHPLDDGGGQLKEKGVYLLPSCDRKSDLFATPEKAVKEGLPWLIKQLEDQGCPAFAGHSTPQIKEEPKKLDPYNSFEDFMIMMSSR